MRIVIQSFILFLLLPQFMVSQEKPLVVTSASMMADMARNIGGDKIEVRMIVPIGGDPHLHEPTPEDARLVAKANLILINGLTFEGWINELIENSGTQAQTITITQGVDILSSQQYKNSADPHAWMDASNGIIYAKNILRALNQLDPSHSKYFSDNFTHYEKELLELDEYIQNSISTIPSTQRILITSHDAFQYYGKRYGIRLEAIMGISTEAEAQTSDVIRVNRTIKENKVPAIFVESTINPKLIEQIARDNNIKIGGKLFADSLGDKKSPADTYINMLKYNTKTIVEALSQEYNYSIEQDQSETNYTFLWILTGILLLGLLLLITKLNR